MSVGEGMRFMPATRKIQNTKEKPVYTKLVNLLKLTVSAYFVFVGVELVKIMMDQRPEDMTKKLLIATVFLVVGAGYFVWTLGRMSGRLRKKVAEVWAGWQEEARQEAKRQEAKRQLWEAKRHKGGNRDSSMFRTAPMEPVGESIQGTITIKNDMNGSVMHDVGESAVEQVVPDSWDDVTKAMWLDEEEGEDPLQRYWRNPGAVEDEPEAPPELLKDTQKLPVISQDTQEILEAADGATRVIPRVSGTE